MNSSYGGLHISVKNKRNKEASDEVYIQDQKYECFWEGNSMARNVVAKFSSRHRELDIISWFDLINDY